MSTPPSKKMQIVTLEKCYLPDDVLGNIFMWLPVKLLAQMKSLCKCWNALISHPFFIKSHLHHSTHNHSEILLVFIYDDFASNEPLKFTAHSSRYPHIQLTDLIKPPPLDTNKHYNPGFSKVIGSVNGLICFSVHNGGEEEIHIWNPSLSALIDIPPFTIPADLLDYGIFLRFVYDPKNDDYKVFMARFRVGADGSMVPLVGLYSIRKGSWEFISVKFPSQIKYIYKDNKVVVDDGHDGRLHWIGAARNQETIVAFDLGVKTFTEISLPDSIQDDTFNHVGFLSQKLCVVSCREMGTGDFDVWVMDTYGVAKSWVKHLVLKQQVSSFFIPLGLASGNNFICVLSDGDLALYDPNTAEVKLLKIKTKGFSFHIIPYVESLVWPVATPAKRVAL